MIKKDYVIVNESGVHARPATRLVTLSSKYKCDVKLSFKNNEVDLKSIIGVMSLAVYKGENISITCDGVDEQEAATNLNNLIKELNLAKEL